MYEVKSLICISEFAAELGNVNNGFCGILRLLMVNSEREREREAAGGVF